jgi:hypothetical protein
MNRLPKPPLGTAPVVNKTGFAAEAVMFEAPSPRIGRTLIVKATCEMTDASVAHPAAAQLALVAADHQHGDPKISAIRYESDFVPFKPRADALCVGNAYPNRGKPGPNCIAAFGVGSWLKQIVVVGDRTWKAGAITTAPTAPEPFVSMPVSFERAYGGRDPSDPDGLRWFAQNPIGKGYTTSENALRAGLALPNLEDPAHLIRSWKDQPVPQSFGPVGRTWQPRLACAGTYDKRWLEPDPPIVPEDFDEAYYNCAPRDQQIDGYLRGDETVRVKNMHPVHVDLTFTLPKMRVRCLADREREAGRQLEDVPTHLDTLWVDMEAMMAVLVWRARLLDSAAAGVSHLLVISEPLESAASPPEAHRHHIDEFEAAEAEPDFGEQGLEPADIAQGIPDLEEASA